MWFELKKKHNFMGQFSTLKNLLAVVGTTCDRKSASSQTMG